MGLPGTALKDDAAARRFTTGSALPHPICDPLRGADDTIRTGKTGVDDQNRAAGGQPRQEEGAVRTADAARAMVAHNHTVKRLARSRADLTFERRDTGQRVTRRRAGNGGVSYHLPC